MVIRFILEDKSNNHKDNLEWCSHQYNVEYSKAKEWMVVSPTGEVLTIYNLAKYCRDNQLDYATMQRVINGDPRHHSYKGYTRYAD